MTQLKLYKRKANSYVLLGVCILFVLAGIYALIMGGWIFGCVLIILSGVSIYFLIKFLRNPEPLYVIDDTGIYRKKGMKPEERLLWKDVESVFIEHVDYGIIICFHVNNNAAVLASKKSFMGRQLLRLTMKKFGSYFIVSPMALDYNPDALFDFIKRKHREMKYGKYT